jgi:hypothetical protein
MGRRKSRNRAAAATPAEDRAPSSGKSGGKRARAKSSRAAAPAKTVTHGNMHGKPLGNPLGKPHGQPPRPAHTDNSRRAVTARNTQSSLPPIDWSAAFAPLARAPEPPLWQEISRLLKRRIAKRKRELSVRARWQGLRLRFALRRAWQWIAAFALRLAAALVREMRARVIEPVLWPIRQIRQIRRETVATALAALAVTMIAVGWLATYRALVPVHEVRAPVVLTPPPAPAPAEKAFTERVVTPAFADIDLTDDDAGLEQPAKTTAAAPPAEDVPTVVLPRAAEPLPSPAKRKSTRRRTREN